MAQTSLPQAGSGVGDSGPYTSSDWAKLFEVMFTGDQFATQGVLRNYLNELEVTSAGVTISIDNGGGFCYGHWLLNEFSIDITALPCAGAQTSWHRVILVQNETAAAYNTNLLLPAAYAAGVPRNSCRIAILRGACGFPGALPALLTGPNYYMVELARYQMTGGSVGTITDYRDYCNFSTEVSADIIENRTREFFVPALIGHNSTDGTDIALASTQNSDGLGPSIPLPDNKIAFAQGRTKVPLDYVSDWTVTAVVAAADSGNAFSGIWAYYAPCAWPETSLGVNTGYGVEAVIDDGAGRLYYNCINALDLPDAGLLTSHFLRLDFRRDATNPLDTINDELDVFGFLISYTADS